MKPYIVQLEIDDRKSIVYCKDGTIYKGMCIGDCIVTKEDGEDEDGVRYQTDDGYEVLLIDMTSSMLNSLTDTISSVFFLYLNLSRNKLTSTNSPYGSPYGELLYNKPYHAASLIVPISLSITL